MVRDPATCPLPDYVCLQGYGCMAADRANNPPPSRISRKYWTEIFQDYHPRPRPDARHVQRLREGVLTMRANTSKLENFHEPHIIRRVLLASTAILAGGLCQPELIDRTQPNYTKKSDLLDGQWYYKNTIVGSPKTRGRHAPSATAARSRRSAGRFRRDLLVGYRTYESSPAATRASTLESSKIGDGRLQGRPPLQGQRRWSRTRSRATSIASASTTPRPVSRPTCSSKTRRIAPGTSASSCASTGANAAQQHSSSATDPASSYSGIAAAARTSRYVTKQDSKPDDNALGRTSRRGRQAEVLRLHHPGDRRPAVVSTTRATATCRTAMFNPTYDCESATFACAPRS